MDVLSYLSPPEPVLQPCDCTSGHKLPCGARAQGPRERACSTCPITSEEAPPPHRRLLPLLLPLLLRGDSGLFVPSRTAAAHLLTWHTDFLLWKVSTTNSVNGVGASERVPTSPLILPVSQAGRHRRITLSVDVRHEPSCCCCCCNSAERSHCTVCERERERDSRLCVLMLAEQRGFIRPATGSVCEVTAEGVLQCSLGPKLHHYEDLV